MPELTSMMRLKHIRCFASAFANTILLLFLSLVLPNVARAQYLWTTNNDGTINIHNYTGNGEVVAIPATINNRPVESIGYYAFAWANLTRVVIPSSVTNIEDFAFAGCSNLNLITVDGHNSFYSSINGVLFNKKQTTLIEFPCGVGGNYKIPPGVTKIWDNAFYECDRLTRVIIPRSVTDLGYTPFSFCTALTSITVDTRNAFYSSINGVVFNKGQTELVACPSGLVGHYGCVAQFVGD